MVSVTSLLHVVVLPTSILERTTTNTLHTVELWALYRVGGLDAVLAVCKEFMGTIESIVNTKVEDRSEIVQQELVHAYGGLKVALHLVHPIISSKPLFESGQTVMLLNRDKKDTDPDYFEPHAFLVKMRLAALPVVRDLWEASWLISAPLSVSKSVVQTVLELTNGENEEPKGDVSGEHIVSGAVPRVNGPDEGRIRQLTDMGFPRSAAERALMRTHNNVNAATELLLAHPFPLPPDPNPVVPEPVADDNPAPQDVAPVNEAALDDDAVAAEAMPVDTPSNDDEIVGDQGVSDVPEALTISDPLIPSPKPIVQGKSAEEWRKELDEAREPLRAGIGRKALLLVDEHISLIFDLHIAFIRPVTPHQQQSVRDLVENVKAFSPSAYDVQEQPLANRCRLLALVLCETPSSLGTELRATLMDNLLALLLSNPLSTDNQHPYVPKWLAAHLLVTESLFTLSDEPRAITLPKEDEPIIAEDISTGPSLTEARSIVFDFCLRLLGVPNLPSDELLSTLRLFVLLTRDHKVATQFVTRGGVPLLFNRLKASAVTGSSSYIATILRHIVEDSTTVQHVMQQAIKRYFSLPRSRIVEVGTYVRTCSAMALRDSKTFIEVTKSLCQLGAPFSASRHLSLKDESMSSDQNPLRTTEAATSVDMMIDPPSSKSNEAPGDSLETVVHFLVGEVMRTAKDTPGPTDASPHKPHEDATVERPTSGTGPSVENAAGSIAPTSQDNSQYSCFLMQCLTELLFSYDSCKTAFLSYSTKKRSQVSAKETANKHRTTALHFILSDLVTFGTINPQSNADVRNRITLCNWAMSVIVALCVDSSTNHEAKDVSPELVSVRKFVLEAVSRAIKDSASSDNVDARYGRLLALADLCHRLLTVRFNTPSRKQLDDTPTHIAKVMLEKNFVATLTSALADVDLNYPNVRGLVASILRPLEYL